jgi:DNA-binding MarR family transcriptional regulator
MGVSLTMTDDALLEEAERLEELLPALARRLFTLPPEHPAMELPVAQLRVCTLLQTGPRSMSGLGEELDISVSAVTQIADRLERAGLVARIHGGDDRRTKKLQLTLQGTEMMRSRREIRVRRVAHALARLSPEVRETVLHAMQALLDASLAGMPEGAGADPVNARLER